MTRGRSSTYEIFSSTPALAGVAASGESTIMSSSISPVQTTISGAISSEPFIEEGFVDGQTCSGSEEALLTAGDRDFAGLAMTEMRVERRGSKSLTPPFITMAFPKRLDCDVRDLGEAPIIAIWQSTGYVIEAFAISGRVRSVWSSLLTGPARPGAIRYHPKESGTGGGKRGPWCKRSGRPNDVPQVE